MRRVPTLVALTTLLLGAPAAAAAQTTETSLGDAAIAHIAVTANTIDADIARLAEGRTTNEQVLGFARNMISSHTAVNERAVALAKKLGVTPQDNDVSRSLNAGAKEARAQLSQLEGSDFDRAYIEREVGFHQAVLGALDQTLIPGASNAELKALLEQVRPVIAVHLDHAKSLQSGALSSAR